MNIVVLDGHTLNPGDLSWDALGALGKCHVFARTPPDLVCQRAEGAEILLTNKVSLGRDHFPRLPVLRYVGVTATGYNIIDTAAARERGITVTNVPAYGTASVAQLTMALLLELAHHAGPHAQGVREGRWSKSPDWCYWELPLVELDGLTLGIVGHGRIGRAVAALGRAFGMRILAVGSKAPAVPEPGVEFTDLDAIFRRSDVVSLHCPLTPETKHLVNAARLALMKPTAFLLNTSRGPLIDEAALADALNAGRLAGAGLDVLSAEPPPMDHPLLRAKNCVITPHLAWATRAARTRLINVAVENVRAFLAGRPQNVVN